MRICVVIFLLRSCVDRPSRIATCRPRFSVALAGALGLTFAALINFTAAAEDAPRMTVSGQYEITSTGAFTYSIPIITPPGTGGMTPDISLSYSSQNGDGPEGFGWLLNGLTTIVRCPRTIAQDGVHGGVNYDINDRFCMGGQRLILISGTYGANNSEYRTELESFAKIIAHGTAGSGPQWFEVHTRQGKSLELGNTTDSRVLAQGKPTVRAWAVDKSTDPAGNYLTFTYTNDATNSQQYPLEIDYTGNANASPALTPYNSIRFTYTTRPDTVPLYQAGSISKNTVLLTHIKTYNGATVVTDYQLGYRLGSTTTHSRLTSVTQCDATGINCLPPISFGWQGGNGLGTINSRTETHILTLDIPTDFDGDGRNDFLGLTTAGGGPIFLGMNDGTFASSNFALPSTSQYFGTTAWAIANLDSDGYADLLAYSTLWTTTSVHAFKNNKIDSFLAGMPSGSLGSLATGGYGDYNGDGLLDYALLDSTSHSIIPYYGDGNGTFTAAAALTPSINAYFVWTGDFDGDGCTDGITQGAGSSIYFTCKPATSSIGVPNWQSLGAAPTLLQLVTGDFNGDGKTDVLAISSNGVGGSPACANETMYLSTGTSLVATSFAVPSDWCKYTVATGDFNGDGKTDIVLIADNKLTIYGYTDHYGPGHNHSIWLSTGSGFVQAGTIAGPSTSNPITSWIGDWNSDGVTDIWLDSTEGDRLYTVSYAPEFLNSISNGVGSTVSITYDSINKNGTFYVKGTSAPYPTVDVDGAIYTVSHISTTDGSGNTSSSTYAYAGAKKDLSGRGFLGFSQMSSSNDQTGVEEIINYRTDFPYIGLVSSQSTIGCSQTLNSTSNTYAATNLGGTRNVVSLQQSIVTMADCDGTALPSTTSAFTYDSYGNILTQSDTDSDGSSKVTTNTYNNDTTHWLLGESLTSSVQRAVGSSNITKHATYTHDSTTGLITSETAEASLATTDPQRFETDYGYDAFGNVTSSAVKSCVWSGASCTQQTRTRVTGFDMTTYHGSFPTIATNPLSQSESWAYSLDFGEPTSHIGPNGLTMSWSYDTFGRKTLETSVDSNKTAYAYTYCTGLPSGESCPTNAQFDLIATPQNSGGAQNGAIVVIYYDGLSRVVAQDTQGFDGSWIRVATQYDANGRVAQASRPYFLASGTPMWTVNNYDMIGRVTQAAFPDGSYTTTAYHGLSTSVTKHVLRPNLSALDETTTTVKNAQGQVASVTDANSKVISYVYDAFADLLTVTDPSGHTTTNTYDLRGRKLTSSDPDMGNWSYMYNGYSELYQQTDAKSQTTTLIYDVLGRVVSSSDATFNTNWTWDTATKGIGKLATATTGSNYLRTPAYDSLGRPSTTTLALDGTNYIYTTTYNSDGRIATVSYPSGLVAKYLYNAYGYLCRVTDNAGTPTCTAAGGATVFWTANARDAELHLTLATAGNNIATTQVFDPNTGLVQQIRAGTSDSVANFSYTFDSIGDLYASSDMLTNVSESFGYDILNRLTSYQVNTNPAKSVTYDYLGNITSKSDVGTYTYGSGAGPHAVTSITGAVNGVVNPTYVYDPNGNMMSGAGRTIAYTSFNMAATITEGSNTLALSYDSEHARYKQVATGAGAGTTLYLNDETSGAMAEKITSGANTTWHDYIMADGRIVTEKFSGATTATNYFILDHLGSVAIVADSFGTVIERLSYDAWGKRRNSDGSDNTTCSITSSTTRGFTGHEEMDSVCLVNANARVYEPTIGRFTAADTIVPDPLSGQSYNPYSYIQNNPLSATDPTGHNDLGEIGTHEAGVSSGPSVADRADHELAWDPDYACTGFCGSAGYGSFSGGSGASSTMSGLSAFGISATDNISKAENGSNQSSNEYVQYFNEGDNPQDYQSWSDNGAIETVTNQAKKLKSQNDTGGGMQLADATINDYRNAVGGLGHIGIFVGDDPSRGYYPKKESGVTKVEQGLGADVPGAVKKDDDSELGKPARHTVHTTSAQDKAMRDYISRRIKNPGEYNLYERNCKDFVRSVLDAGGVKTKNDMIPNNWFDDNFKEPSK